MIQRSHVWWHMSAMQYANAQHTHRIKNTQHTQCHRMKLTDSRKWFPCVRWTVSTKCSTVALGSLHSSSRISIIPLWCASIRSVSSGKSLIQITTGSASSYRCNPDCQHSELLSLPTFPCCTSLVPVLSANRHDPPRKCWHTLMEGITSFKILELKNCCNFSLQ